MKHDTVGKEIDEARAGCTFLMDRGKFFVGGRPRCKERLQREVSSAARAAYVGVVGSKGCRSATWMRVDPMTLHLTTAP